MSGLSTASNCGTGRISTDAELLKVPFFARLNAVQVATTVYCPTVPEAV